MRKAIILVLVAFVSVAAFAENASSSAQRAALPPTNGEAVAVFDLSGADSDNLNTALFFPSPSTTVMNAVPAICSDPAGAFKILRETNGATDRWISVKGSVVDIRVVYPTGTDAPTIEI